MPIPSAHSTESSDVPIEHGGSILDQILVSAFDSHVQTSVIPKMGGAKLEIWIELVSMVTKTLLSFRYSATKIVFCFFFNCKNKIILPSEEDGILIININSSSRQFGRKDPLKEV